MMDFPSSSSTRWKVGDIVLAEYTDKQYYDAVVEEMGCAMIHVRFVGYGDRFMVSEYQIKERPPLHPDFKEKLEEKTGHLYYYNEKTGESTWTRPVKQEGNNKEEDKMGEIDRRAFEHARKMMRERNLQRMEAFSSDDVGLFFSDTKNHSDQFKSQHPQQMEVTSAWVPNDEAPGMRWTKGRNRSSFRMPLPGGPCGCGKPGC